MWNHNAGSHSLSLFLFLSWLPIFPGKVERDDASSIHAKETRHAGNIFDERTSPSAGTDLLQLKGNDGSDQKKRHFTGESQPRDSKPTSPPPPSSQELCVQQQQQPNLPPPKPRDKAMGEKASQRKQPRFGHCVQNEKQDSPFVIVMARERARGTLLQKRQAAPKTLLRAKTPRKTAIKRKCYL